MLSVKRAVGARLRDLRGRASRTLLEVSIDSGIHQSRLSRIEQGRMLARPEEVRALLHLYSARSVEVTEIEQLLEDGHQPARVMISPQHPAGGATLGEHQEQLRRSFEGVRRFRWFEPMIVPGILQVRPYAEGIFARSTRRAPERRGVVDDEVRAAVAVRLQNQQWLFEQQRTFEFVVSQAVCDIAFGTPEAMAAQCHQLVQLSFLPNVSIGIIRSHVVPPVGGSGAFAVLDESAVHVEFSLGSIELTASFQVDRAVEDFEALQSAAVYGDDARAILAEAAGRHATRAARARLTEPGAGVERSNGGSDQATGTGR